MGIINVSSLKPGMILAADVKDRNGRLLLTQGQTLNEKGLRVLKIWGVTEVDVEGVSRENAEEEILSELDPAILTAAEAYTRSRFVHTDLDHEAVAELFRITCLYKARRMMRLGQEPDDVTPFTAREGEPDLQCPAPVALGDFSWEELKLGSLPMVFHKLVEVVNDPRSSATDVAEVIGNDPDLSLRLLKVVNSSFYGLTSKVDTISRAVAIIGSNQLVSLAMGMSVITFFKGISQKNVDMDAFWRHSIACGVASRILASYLNSPNSERFFVAGLLHDIGRLVIYIAFPDHANAALALARHKMILLTDAERRTVGFTHHQLGELLMNNWKLPSALARSIRFHHDPMQGADPVQAGIITMADAIANSLECGSSGERLTPRMNPLALDALELPLSVIAQTTMLLEHQVEEILGFFNSDD